MINLAFIGRHCLKILDMRRARRWHLIISLAIWHNRVFRQYLSNPNNTSGIFVIINNNLLRILILYVPASKLYIIFCDYLDILSFKPTLSWMAISNRILTIVPSSHFLYKWKSTWKDYKLVVNFSENQYR